MKSPRMEVRPTKESLATGLADFILGRFLTSEGRFSLNLSGGSTPKTLYELLATDIYREKFDWTRMHVFFGDERFVPFDHPDSNYRMAREALLAHVPIPDDHIYPVPTQQGEPAEAAAAYEVTLQTYYGKDRIDPSRPIFDVTLLGLGEDGHTASLFPGTDALKEARKWVTAVIGAKPEPRISMTYPVLASSDALVFLVAGAGKRDILQKVLDGDPALPASHVEPNHDFYVFCDDKAAGKS